MTCDGVVAKDAYERSEGLALESVGLDGKHLSFKRLPLQQPNTPGIVDGRSKPR